MPYHTSKFPSSAQTKPGQPLDHSPALDSVSPRANGHSTRYIRREHFSPRRRCLRWRQHGRRVADTRRARRRRPRSRLCRTARRHRYCIRGSFSSLPLREVARVFRPDAVAAVVAAALVRLGLDRLRAAARRRTCIAAGGWCGCTRPSARGGRGSPARAGAQRGEKRGACGRPRRAIRDAERHRAHVGRASRPTGINSGNRASRRESHL
jgi:hypothetical protein